MFIKISRCLAIFSPSLVGLLFSSKTSVQMTFSFLLCLASEASDADEEWPEVKLPFVVGILNESFHSRTDVTARARLEGKWSLNIQYSHDGSQTLCHLTHVKLHQIHQGGLYMNIFAQTHLVFWYTPIHRSVSFQRKQVWSGNNIVGGAASWFVESML